LGNGRGQLSHSTRHRLGRFKRGSSVLAFFKRLGDLLGLECWLVLLANGFFALSASLGSGGCVAKQRANTRAGNVGQVLYAAANVGHEAGLLSGRNRLFFEHVRESSLSRHHGVQRRLPLAQFQEAAIW
jgi:hypothetical protein